ncbi:MAG: hypothetical protein K8R09_06780, partial [Desulfobacterales bacterium]|nr:hypothetical protein [Desulfobacterales bacterium]MCD4787906.1 hypothetical protein [Desulfobacterales bacterium]
SGRILYRKKWLGSSPVVTYKDGNLEFDFTEHGLAPIEPLWDKLLEMLQKRREANKHTSRRKKPCG